MSLRRPWRLYATVVFLHSQIDAPVIPEGWTEWLRFGMPSLLTAHYAEFDPTGPGATAPRAICICSTHRGRGGEMGAEGFPEATGNPLLRGNPRDRVIVFTIMLRSFIGGFAVPLFCAFGAWGQVYTINTLAGNGAAGFADGSGTSAQLNIPGGIFVTPSGTVYVADGSNYRIRVVSASGSVSTVAGNGTLGYSGDGAAANAAYLSAPLGVVVDGSGNIFIADTANAVIRKVTTDGKISTYAGNNGFGQGYSGDAGPATNAQLWNPAGLALDSAGNLYIADSSNNAIRKVTASTGNITTIVGSGTTATTLNSPIGVAIDSSGNLYIANQGSNRILKFTAATGKVTTFAGTGGPAGFAGDGLQATLAQLADPKGVALDAAGNIYIADTVNNRIRKVAANGVITTIAGTGRPGYSGDGGPATAAQLNSPGAVAVDSAGNVYVADTQNSVIRVLQPSLPTVANGGVTNAASYLPKVSPGALASVFGTGFGAAITSPAANPNLPTNSGGVSVTVNGTAAPLYYVSPGQINFQVPWGTAVGTASVVVSVSGGASNTVAVPVVAAGPGLFNAGGAAIVQNYPDYSVNGPSNGAPAGSTIIAYLTGSGPVSPSVNDGAPAPSTSLVKATSSWSATIGGAAAQVSFIGLTPGFVGLTQANIVVPAGLAPGSYALTVTIGSDASNAANITVK